MVVRLSHCCQEALTIGPTPHNPSRRAARCNLMQSVLTLFHDIDDCFRDSHLSIALASQYLILLVLALEVWFQFGLFDEPPLWPRRIAMTSSSASGTSTLPAQLQKLRVFLYRIYHNLLKPYLCLSPPSLYPLYSYYPSYVIVSYPDT